MGNKNQQQTKRKHVITVKNHLPYLLERQANKMKFSSIEIQIGKSNTISHYLQQFMVLYGNSGNFD